LPCLCFTPKEAKFHRPNGTETKIISYLANAHCSISKSPATKPSFTRLKSISIVFKPNLRLSVSLLFSLEELKVLRPAAGLKELRSTPKPGFGSSLTNYAVYLSKLLASLSFQSQSTLALSVRVVLVCSMSFKNVCRSTHTAMLIMNCSRVQQ
jgi:hypothetical protein